MDLEPKDIGIITPYARQVAALRFGVLGGGGGGGGRCRSSGLAV